MILCGSLTFLTALKISQSLRQIFEDENSQKLYFSKFLRWTQNMITFILPESG